MNNPYAPAFHFLPKKGWINDPNGLVYFNDQWHLFYQYYNPEEVDGMQWGHAISDDLINWEHLPAAISPDQHGQIWSGSAVVDWKDSSGLFGGKPGIVCLFTYWDKDDHRQCQGLSYSSDGVHFTTYEGNPIIPQLRYLDGHPDDKNFRDPKVFWHEGSNKWIMIVAGGLVRIFSSDNLIDWTFESIDEHEHTECPDLFQLPIDGDENNKTWVLSLGGRAYRLGDFDGKRFTPTTDAIPMTGGPDFYAGQSWSDAPDHRRIMISWIFGWKYESGPRPVKIKNAFPTGDQAGSCLSLPYELSLKSTADGPRLIQEPVKEANQLWQQIDQVKDVVVDGSATITTESRSFQLQANLKAGSSEECRFELKTHNGGTIGFGVNTANKTLFIDRSNCGYDHLENFASNFETVPLAQIDDLDVRIIVDAESIEIFADKGAVHTSIFALIEEQDELRCIGDFSLSNCTVSKAKDVMTDAAVRQMTECAP